MPVGVVAQEADIAALVARLFNELRLLIAQPLQHGVRQRSNRISTEDAICIKPDADTGIRQFVQECGDSVFDDDHAITPSVADGTE
jgi:hypothetical protein